MRFLRSTVLAACVAAAGCGQDRAQPGVPPARPLGPNPVAAINEADESPGRDDLAPDRDPDVSDKVDRTPRVSDDAGQIAAVRKLYERQQQAIYAEAFEQLRGSGILISRYRNALERRKPRALADLKRIMDGGSKATDEFRARAARVLIDLGDPSGEAFLLDAVRTGRGPRRAAALRELDDWNIERKVDLGLPERARLILDCLDDPDPAVVQAAAGLCTAREIPGTEAKLVGLIKDGKAKDPGRLARELAAVARGPEAVRVVRDELLRGPTPANDPWSQYVLRHLLANPDPKVSEPIRAAFLRRTLGHDGKQRYQQGVVRNLAPVADRTTVPVLEDIFAHARDPVSRAYAVEALARIDPQLALDRALELARAENRFYLVTEALEKVASERNADRIIDAFLEAHRRERRRVTMIETRLLMERLGPRGRRVIAESLDDLEPEARTWATWKLKGLGLDAAIDDLRAAGIIKMSREAVFEAMRRGAEANGSSAPIDRSDPDLLSSALGWAGIRTLFDTETDEIPCNHHLLVMEFAANSGGVFDPECAVQTWHRKNQDDDGAPYTVQFLYKGRLYRFGAENHRDWYDVEAVHRALNYALETAGRKERFIAMEPDGQSAILVFADPAAFRPFAAKYGLVPAKDPGAAEREGKAFERQVIEQIKGQEGP